MAEVLTLIDTSLPNRTFEMLFSTLPTSLKPKQQADIYKKSPSVDLYASGGLNYKYVII